MFPLIIPAIGRRTRQIRGFDLTQHEFARMLGVGQAAVSKFEKGLSFPSVETLLRLTEYSGKTIDWIVTGEDLPTKK